MTEYGKGGKPRGRLSTLPTLLGNPFGITTFPWPRLLAYFKVQEHERPSPKPLDLKGVVMEVLGPKCNERSGTLNRTTMARADSAALLQPFGSPGRKPQRSGRRFSRMIGGGNSSAYLQSARSRAAPTRGLSEHACAFIDTYPAALGPKSSICSRRRSWLFFVN
jgi:hypothetical protein